MLCYDVLCCVVLCCVVLCCVVLCCVVLCCVVLCCVVLCCVVLQVEDLRISRWSSVTEVRRIQTAFQVLVAQLAEYKSFMPDALFHGDEDAGLGGAGDESESDDTVTLPQRRTPLRPVTPLSKVSLTSAEKFRGRRSVASGSSCIAPGGHRFTRRKTACLVVAIVDFAPDGFIGEQAEDFLDSYLGKIHQTATAVRGNVDVLFGAQVWVYAHQDLPEGHPFC